jgi:hypothetical protein
MELTLRRRRLFETGLFAGAANADLVGMNWSW